MKKLLGMAVLSALVASCGGGGSDDQLAPLQSPLNAVLVTDTLDTNHWLTSWDGAAGASTDFRLFQRYAATDAGRLTKVSLNICAGFSADPAAASKLEIRRGAEFVGSPVVGTFAIPYSQIPGMNSSGCAFNKDNSAFEVVVDTASADIQVAAGERMILVLTNNQPNTSAQTWWFPGPGITANVFPAGWAGGSSDAFGYFNDVNAYKFKTYLSPVIQPWGFGGFLAPIDNLPTTNSVKGGSTVPVKFRFSEDKGLDIFKGGAPTVVGVSCDFSSVSQVEELVETAGGSDLSYDRENNVYTYAWKTDKAWSDSCRQLVVSFNDGTTHRANFYFK